LCHVLSPRNDTDNILLTSKITIEFKRRPRLLPPTHQAWLSGNENADDRSDRTAPGASSLSVRRAKRPIRQQHDSDNFRRFVFLAFEYPARLQQIRLKPVKGASLFTGRENQWN
jgi:hypothetical protein